MEDYLIEGHTPVPLPKTHFPVLATDIAMPDPHLTSAILFPEGTERYDKYNVTAQIGQGNGYGTMEESNKYIRTLMKGDNVLNPATVQLMQKDFSAAIPLMDWVAPLFLILDMDIPDPSSAS